MSDGPKLSEKDRAWATEVAERVKASTIRVCDLEARIAELEARLAGAHAALEDLRSERDEARHERDALLICDCDACPMHQGRCPYCDANRLNSRNEPAEKAEAACAQMRAALENFRSGNEGDGFFHDCPVSRECEKCISAEVALASDAGKGWVPPEQAAALQRERDHAQQHNDSLKEQLRRVKLRLDEATLSGSTDAGRAFTERMARYERALTTIREQVEGSEAEPDKVLASIGREARAALEGSDG